MRRAAHAAAVPLAALALALAGPRPARAEPYLAVRSGVQCSVCHVNRTGGGMRTDLFKQAAAGFLKYPQGLFSEPAGASEGFSGTLSRGLSLGADFRAVNVSGFRDEPDAAGRVAGNRLARDYEENEFEIDEAVGYLRAELVPEALTLYASESFAPGAAANREAFLLLPVPRAAGSYVKVGKFYPPFGLRLQDDAAFTRSRTGFTFSRPDEGLELGIDAGGASAAVSVTDGGDGGGGERSAKLYAANAAWLKPGIPFLRSVLLGGSIARNDISEQTYYGAYLGASPWRLTLLAEADLIRDDSAPGDALESLAAHAEVDWLVVDWLNARLAYDYYDPDRGVKEDHQDRVTVGLEPFLSRFLQVRLSYVVANGIPQRPQDSAAELRAEVHLFF